ncbi:MAG TPA: pseudouridine synthase [Phnomibacter sp.]|nr:pseudouridine synthase [Phnomibacter sp.]
MGNFDKFSKKELSGAKKKEAFRQEKKTVKKETEAYFKDKKAKQKAGLIEKKTLETGKKKLPLKSAPRPEEAPAKNAKIVPVKAIDKTAPATPSPDGDNMPLNKYVAHGGLCSRRDAAIWVKEGKIKVNGKVVLEPSYKVQPGDKVTSNGKLVEPKQHLVYILLNKPKDFLTTASDDQGRKTVMDIIKNATTERVYPVGRLDRNTTGVLLLTNDGDLAQQLTHPKFEIKKIYEVRLDKPVIKADLDQLVQGITLDDGPISADAAAYADPKDKSVIGVEIHSGRNRIVRRMFEHLGYDVKNLDRVMFASLTKKNVERGKWRFLTEKEVRLLKYFQKSKK